MYKYKLSRLTYSLRLYAKSFFFIVIVRGVDWEKLKHRNWWKRSMKLWDTFVQQSEGGNTDEDEA